VNFKIPNRNSKNPKNKNNNDSTMRNIILWAIIVAVTVVMYFATSDNFGSSSKIKEVPYSDFISYLDQDSVQQVHINGDTIVGSLSNGQQFSTYAPNDAELIPDLKKHNVRIVSEPRDKHSLLGSLLSWIPILFWIVLMVLMFRQMGSGAGGGKIMNFSKSKAKLLNENQVPVTFDDVAGIDEAKQELEEIVQFLQKPKKFLQLGGRIPKGVLLVGAPGTGKTLLAKAIAGEAKVPFFSISGSDFVEMFVGVGASRVRDMFEQAKKNAPCLLFIDEIDAVGRQRGAGLGGGNDEREQTLNQLLVEMDGFEASESIILIAATNRPDVLDPALLRPGRFDRQVVVPYPDILGRDKILLVHMKKLPLAPDVDSKIIARGTPGFSGADLKNLVNEAALLAARKNKKLVSMDDFESARDKVLMGAERRSMAMSDDEKKLTAYHEAGHAIVGLHLKDSDPIHKATIIPRGRALGLVMRLPEGDRVSESRARLKADMTVAMGGRIAEEMIFGENKVTTGASSDIQMATKIARRMVTEWGMSNVLGPLTYGEPEQEVFLGHSVTQHKNISEKTAQSIDSEIRKLVTEAYKKAATILQKNKHELELLAQGLLEFETLSGEEIKNLLKGKKPNRDFTPQKKKSTLVTQLNKKAKEKKSPGKEKKE